MEVLEAEEQEEEEEAKNIQKRLAANLSEEDYDLSFFQVIFTARHLDLVFTAASPQLVWCLSSLGVCYGRR